MKCSNTENETNQCARPALRRRRILVSVVVGAALLGFAALGVEHVVDAIGSGGDRNARLADADARRQAGRDSGFAQQVLADEWSDRISSDTFWRNRRPSGGSAGPNVSTNRPSRLQGPQPEPGWFVAPAPSYWGQPPVQFQPAPRSSPRHQSGYRTVCVRLCDGFFFPISFGASEGSLGRDQATCSNSCAGARLFYGRASSDDPDDMIDLNGQRYSKLPNANLFRTQYSESCKCKPHSWEQASVDRHRIFALEDQRRKGNRNVVAELEELKSRQLIDRRIKGRRETSRSRRLGNEVATTEPQTTALAVPPSAPRSDVSRGQGGGERAGMVTGTTTVAVTVAQQRTALTSAQAAALPDAGPVSGQVSNGGNLASVQVSPSGDLSRADRALAYATVPAPSATPSAQATGAFNPVPFSEAQPDVPFVMPAVVPAKPGGKRSKDRQRQAQTARPGGMMGLGAVASRSPPARQHVRGAEWMGRTFGIQ